VKKDDKDAARGLSALLALGAAALAAIAALAKDDDKKTT
jgi:hypothetical protein